jgi:hypothetical protein
MTTTTRADLSDAWGRLTQGLEWLETQPEGGKIRAAELRAHLVTHFGNLCAGMAGRRERCPIHPTSFKLSCRECRSEKIAVREYPEVDPEAQRISARIVGERHEKGL